jgi:hypothetical protein
MSFPYLDLPGFNLRSEFTLPESIALLESSYPGFVEQQISDFSSYIDARLRKRYGNAANLGNSLPFGQMAPLFVASGTNPPGVALTGRPTLGSMRMRAQITTGGPAGTAVFRWSSDGGKTWTNDVLTGPAVVLGTTGLTAGFSSGVYGIDNQYAAAEPVPAIVLRWLVAGVAYATWNRRGRNPQDAFVTDLKERYATTLDELKEAADSKDGLFDLPASEDLNSAITTAGPLSYTETSPYVPFDIEVRRGRGEDCQGRGT